MTFPLASSLFVMSLSMYKLKEVKVQFVILCFQFQLILIVYLKLRNFSAKMTMLLIQLYQIKQCYFVASLPNVKLRASCNSYVDLYEGDTCVDRQLYGALVVTYGNSLGVWIRWQRGLDMPQVLLKIPANSMIIKMSNKHTLICKLILVNSFLVNSALSY